MEQILGQNYEIRQLALRTFLILSSSRRLITADELCDALAIEDKTDAGEFDEDNIPDLDIVLSACAGLVIHQPDNGLVQLVHKSTQDYFSETGEKWFPFADAQMNAICFSYEKSCGSMRGYTKRPFLAYLDQHRSYHSAKAEEMVRVPSIGETLPEDQRHLTFTLSNPDEAQRFGVSKLVQELGAMKELLLWACENDKHNLVEVLVTQNLHLYTSLEANADMSTEIWTEEVVSESSTTPSTARTGYGSFVPVLDVYPYTDSTRDPRHVRRAMQRGCRTLDEALCAAVCHNAKDIVKLLLKHGASLSARDLHGHTPVGICARENSYDMLSFLLNLPVVDERIVDSYETRYVIQVRFEFEHRYRF